MIRIILALDGLQVVAIALAWWVAPLRLLAWAVLLLAAAGTVFAAREAGWLAGLPRSQRGLAVPLWQLPGLATSALTIALLAGWRGPQVLIVVLQLWELPFAPLLASLPAVRLGGSPLSLWACTLLPWLQCAAALVVALRRPSLPPQAQPLD